jgi:hypothetical protein
MHSLTVNFSVWPSEKYLLAATGNLGRKGISWLLQEPCPPELSVATILLLVTISGFTVPLFATARGCYNAMTLGVAGQRIVRALKR